MPGGPQPIGSTERRRSAELPHRNASGLAEDEVNNEDEVNKLRAVAAYGR